MNLDNFMTLNISDTLLLGTGVVLLLALFLIRYANKRRKQHPDMAAMQNDVRALTTAAVSMGERVLEIERRQRRLAERQDQMDIYDSANQPYEQAIRMAQNGSDVDELVNVCGLSTNEAELIRMMHRLDKAS